MLDLVRARTLDGILGDEARPSVKGKALREWLPSHLKSNPDLSLREHCEDFLDESGVEVSEATMSRNIARFPGQWPLKKVEDSPRTR